MLRLLLPWLTPAAAAVDAARWSAAHAPGSGGEERLLAACRALLAAAAVHRAAGFEAASPDLGLGPASGGVLGVLSSLTTAVLSVSADGVPDPDDWDAQAAELLLEAWVELVADPYRGPVGSSQAAVQVGDAAGRPAAGR